MKKYCRRFKFTYDDSSILKVVADSYDDTSLQVEPELEDEWYWIDTVPYIEERDNGQ